MKKIVLIITMLGVSLSSFASDTVLRLGEYVSLSGDTSSKYKILEVKASAYTSTDAGFTLSRKGCYESKTDTGQGFPYRYSYEAKEASVEIEKSINGRDIILKNIEAKKEESKDALKKKARFYCMRKTGVNLTIKVKVKGLKQIVYAALSLEKDNEGYYVQKPYGNVYISNSSVDFIHIPGLNQVFR